MNGIFVFIGMQPNSVILPLEIEGDKNGFVICSDYMQTSLNGFFNAGDARKGSIAQTASAECERAAAAV